MIKKKIKIPIYDQFTLTIIIDDNITEQVNKITKSNSDCKYKGVFFAAKEGTDLFIALDKKYISPNLIAHECFHAVVYIMNFIVMSLDDSSEEAYAYLMGYLVEQVNKLIK